MLTLLLVCREPSDTPIAAVQPGSNIAGTVRSYEFTCPEGTVVHGDTSVTCLLNGEWSQLTAYCKGLFCFLINLIRTY